MYFTNKFLFLIFICFLSCRYAETKSADKELLFEQYFPLKDSSKRIFVVSGKVNGMRLDTNDSIFCMSSLIKNSKVYFFTDSPNDSSSIIGSEAFCFGVFYFRQGEFFVSPVFWQADLEKCIPDNFPRLFPAKILMDTPYRQQLEVEKREYIFDKIEDLSIKEKVLPACLKLVVIEEWPNAQNVDTVWFQKNTGVVKWIRSTGRVEEIKM